VIIRGIGIVVHLSKWTEGSMRKMGMLPKVKLRLRKGMKCEKIKVK
jgi:hypothetical protein